MGKFREKRAKKKEEKRASKFGVNPVTGKALSRKQFKRVKKTGFDMETGLVMSKKQSKLEYGNVGTRRGRTDKREVVQSIRAETGNTFGNSIAKIVGAAKGNPVPEPQPQQSYEEEEEVVNIPRQHQPEPQFIAPNPAAMAAARNPEADEIQEIDAMKVVSNPSQGTNPIPVTAPKSDNKALIIGIVLVVLVVAGFFIMRKK